MMITREDVQLQGSPPCWIPLLERRKTLGGRWTVLEVYQTQQLPWTPLHNQPRLPLRIIQQDLQLSLCCPARTSIHREQDLLLQTGTPAFKEEEERVEKNASMKRFCGKLPPVRGPCVGVSGWACRVLIGFKYYRFVIYYKCVWRYVYIVILLLHLLDILSLYIRYVELPT